MKYKCYYIVKVACECPMWFRTKAEAANYYAHHDYCDPPVRRRFVNYYKNPLDSEIIDTAECLCDDTKEYIQEEEAQKTKG